MKTLSAPHLTAWRRWLRSHHKSEREVWLLFHKQHTGKPCVAYEDAVREALCFGWIDSLIKRIDDDRYARKFTTRKADSRWSSSNRQRYEELRAAGRLMPAGIDRPPTDRGDAPRPRVPPRVPTYIRAALKDNSAAAARFERLSPSHRRRYVMWVDSAKQDATKARRLKDAIRLLALGKTLGLK